MPHLRLYCVSIYALYTSWIIDPSRQWEYHSVKIHWKSICCYLCVCLSWPESLVFNQSFAVERTPPHKGRNSPWQPRLFRWWPNCLNILLKLHIWKIHSISITEAASISRSVCTQFVYEAWCQSTITKAISSRCRSAAGKKGQKMNLAWTFFPSANSLPLW